MDVVVNSNVYAKILLLLENNLHNLKYLESIIVLTYGIPRRSAASIISINIVRRIKHSHYRILRQSTELWREYNKAVLCSEELGVIIRLAQTAGSSPALLAKLILEQYLFNEMRQSQISLKNIEDIELVNREHSREHIAEESPLTCKISSEMRLLIHRMMRDTSLIEDDRLASEIFLCSLHDEQYGPISEMYNRAVGEEFESCLYKQGLEASLCFELEHELRTRGYDKTPDMKLIVPIAVDGFVVNWIESKGLFGDEAGHRGYISDQYSSYWNRFGSGLVIYWLGYEDSIVDPKEKRFIVRGSFPAMSSIVYLKPLVSKTHLRH